MISCPLDGRPIRFPEDAAALQISESTSIIVHRSCAILVELFALYVEDTPADAPMPRVPEPIRHLII